MDTAVTASRKLPALAWLKLALLAIFVFTTNPDALSRLLELAERGALLKLAAFGGIWLALFPDNNNIHGKCHLECLYLP